MSDFSFGATVLCDEVRREITGKDIIIGAYSGAVVVNSLPVMINLSVWMQVEVKADGHKKLELKIEPPGGANTQMVIEFDVSADNHHPFSLFTPTASIFISKVGVLKISVREIGREKWVLIKKAAVIQGIVTTPYGTQLPVMP